MSRLSKIAFRLIDLLVIFVMTLGSPMTALAQDSVPTLTTDKTEYMPGEIAHITGAGFSAGDYVLSANGPDGTLDWGTVTIDEGGSFGSDSPTLVTAGTYEVYALGDGTSVTSVGFTVVAPSEPTVEPTAEPTIEPTIEPTVEPTPLPTPFIQSDKADYAPGEQVTLTGGYWQGDTQVRIFVNDDEGKTWYRDVIVDVAEDGTIVDVFNLPNWFVATYVVSAGGQQTGRVVTTTFTDSQEDYKHYGDKAPAGWQNGALQGSNSQYFEGEVVPHYWKTEGLAPGQMYGFNIYYDYYDPSSGGFCGFDYISQYNISRNPPPVGSSPYPISSIPGGPGALYTVGAGNVYVNGPYNAGIQRFIQVRFLATTPKVEFYWGLHLAQPGAISGCQGSKAWPGASLQTDVRTVPQFTQYMLGGGGSLQINPGDVIRGSISGFKWNDLDADGVVDGSESKLSSWPIQLCYDSGCSGVIQTTTTDTNGNYNFNVAPGTYFVREIQQPSWSQTYPTTVFYGPLTINASTPTYSNMNFGNRRQESSITIVKDAVPNDPQDFIFYGSFGNFPLDDDSDPYLPNSRTYGNISPGVYTVGEYSTGNWDFSGIACTGDNGNTKVYPGSTQVQIYLDPGENIVCTFTNTKRGSIFIVKNTIGGDGTFDFTSSTLGNFSLTTAGNTAYTSFFNLLPGTYDVKETVPAGWDLTGASCDDGSNPSSISVQPGEKIYCTFTNVKQNPVLTLDKTATPGTYSAVGEIISYSYLVTNSGNIKLAGPVIVGDDKTTATCPDVNTVGNLDGFLDPDESITCNASYAITQDDLNSGSVTNIAIATAGNTDSNEDSETVTAVQSPELTLNKTAAPLTYDSVDDVIDYSYLVTNTGNVRIAGPVTITDDKAADEACPNVNTVGNEDDYLDPGESITCTASYMVTQDDLNNGSVTNVATAHASGTDSNTDTETVTAVQSPALTLDKVATPTIYNAVGDAIHYSYVVTNSGNVTLHDAITVSDDKATVTCPALPVGGLVPNASITCTATYTIAQADLNAGSVTNIAYASSGTTTSNTDTETVTAVQSPALTLVKTAAPATYDSVGDAIGYEYLLTNTGNVTVSGPFTVEDDKTTVTCPPTSSLEPNTSIMCTASYTIIQADLDAGSVTNTAQGKGTFNGHDVLSNEDSETVTAVQTPALTLLKTATPTTYDSGTDVITYNYNLKNTGNVTLSGPFTVTDNKAAVTCPSTSSLAPNASIDCTATYAITQADLDHGSVTNIAQGQGLFNGNAVLSNEDSETVIAVQTPRLTLLKTASPSTYKSADDIISYSYALTNTGNVTLNGPFTVADDKATVTCPATASLAPLAFITCTASYTIAQADLDSGSVTNVAQGKGSFHGNDVLSNTDEETVTAVQTPALKLDKSASPSTYDSAGDVIQYSYLLTNTGNVTLSGPFTVVDNKAPVTCPATATLAPLASITCTASYTITQADLDNGSVTNTAQGHASFSGNPVDSNEDSETVTAIQSPAIDLVKTVTSSGPYDSVGDVITYQLVATNTGNITLSNVSISDPLLGTLTCTQPVTLAPNTALTCTGSYVVTQSDLDAGKVDNTATATGFFKDTPYTDTDNASVPMTQLPSLMLEKTGTFDAGADGFANPDELITYTFKVTNTGNITLHNVTLTDPLAGLSVISCPDTTIAVDSSITCTATYAVTQVDIDAGSVHNLATADSRESEPDDDDNTETLPQNPLIHVVKSSTTTNISYAGQVVPYTFTVTNTGNVTLTGITVADPNCDAAPVYVSGDLNTDTKLQLAETWIYTCNHTVSQLEIDTYGPSVNLAQGANPLESDAGWGGGSYPWDITDGKTSYTDTWAHGLAFTGGKPGYVSACGYRQATVNLGSLKQFSRVLVWHHGMEHVPTIYGVDYWNGSQWLPVEGSSSIRTDLQTTVGYGSVPTETIFSVVTGSKVRFWMNNCNIEHGWIYEFQVFDANGMLLNTVTADSTESPSDTDEHNIPITYNPVISIIKTGAWIDGNANGYADAGETIHYTFAVKNEGNVTLTNVTVADTIGGVSVSGGPTTLDVGETDTTTFTGTYYITQADIDAGHFHNKATTDSNESQPANDEEDVVLPQHPVITLIKSGTFDAGANGYADPGELISYLFTVTNAGNVTLTNVTVTDAKVSPISCPKATLTVGESMTCTGSYAVTQTDIDAGSVYNMATADSKQSDPDSDETTVPLPQHPAIAIDKVTNGADGLSILVGSPITWTYTITNTGNVTLTDVTVTDDILGAVCTVQTLAPAATDTCTLDGTAAAGDYENTGTAAGTPPIGEVVTASDTSSYFGADPQIAITKVTMDGATSGDGLNILIGEPIKWQYTVTNVGNVPLSNVNVVDSQAGVTPTYVSGDTNADGKLDLNETWVFEASATAVTGSYSNTGTASGDYTDSEKHTRTDIESDASSYFGADPQIAIVKVTVDNTTSGDGLNILTGEPITWRYTVTNAGNIPLTNVTVTDSKAGVSPVYISGDANSNNKLDLSETWIFEATGTSVTGNYDNTGTVVGTFTDNAGHTRTDTASDASAYFGADPQIAVTKTTIDGGSSGDGLNILTGETITWRYTVTNMGNVALSNVTVTDNKAGVNPVYVSGDTNSNTKLDLTETWIFEATGTAATGNYSNTGTASGKYTDSAGHVRTDTATDGSSYFGANPQIDITKKTVGSDGSEGDNVFILFGATVTWKYYVTNTGNVALSNVAVTDNKIGAITCPKTTLAIAESMTCTATGTNNTPIGTWYNNTATASGSYTDSAGHTRTATDTDASAYYSQNPGVVTNSSLCDFGANFTLVFTPDVKYYTSSTPAYKLSDSNPGQFFYNVFQTSGTGTVTLTLPYPFVTQGATPIHVYRSLTAVTSNGQTCLQPTNEVKNYQQTVTLSNYPSNNYAGKTTVTLTGLPTSGFIYINIHMDYGLEKLNGWVKSNGANASYNSTINPTMPKVNILNNTAHTFTSSIPNSTDTIYNSNSFKSVKGFGGLVLIKTGVIDGVNVFEGLKSAKIELRDANGRLIETMYTDVNGWYLSTYIPSGKTATFTIKLIGGSGNVEGVVYIYSNQLKSVITGGSNKFGEGAFTINP